MKNASFALGGAPVNLQQSNEPALSGQPATPPANAANVVNSVHTSGRPQTIPANEMPAIAAAAQSSGLLGGDMAVDSRLIKHMEINNLERFSFAAQTVDANAELRRSRSQQSVYFAMRFSANPEGTAINGKCLVPNAWRSTGFAANQQFQITVEKSEQGYVYAPNV